MDLLDRGACYRALQTRDSRFDGRLFVGVATTGVYCRPICPVRTPKFANCRFFPSAAAAQEAGFRPCLRCRPEAAPNLASWRGTSNSVSRALAMIADGALDGGDAGVDALAERLGLGGRQLRRLFKQHLGASPVAVAQTRRVLLAKQLIQETRMSMSDIALASGFGSVRRFNETFQDLFRRPPSELRRTSRRVPDHDVERVGVTLRLPYKPPYDWISMIRYLEARAIEGVEEVAAGVYRRTVSHGDGIGTIEVWHEAARNSVALAVRFPCVRAFPGILARVRRLFDIDADIERIGAHLSRDPILAPLLQRRPGLRAPGAWDGFELAVRAVLGQQVSVAAARRLAGRLVTLCGELVPDSARGGSRLVRVFPSPERVASADLDTLGMPSARRAALRALANAARADVDLFQPVGSVDDAIVRLRAIPGVGQWTAQYIALRALRETDAFPATDTGLLRSASGSTGVRPTPAALLARAEAWRPWRGYAAQHLWAAVPEPLSTAREMSYE